MQAAADELIGMSEAARSLGSSGRGGKPVHPATLTRWIMAGVKLPSGERVKLRALRVGSKWATRPSWLQEFLDATTAGHAPAEATRTPAERQREADAAVAELKKLGA